MNFALHTGDIKSGSTLCNDVTYTRFQTLSNSLNVPSLLTLGDNEWTDCHRTNNGAYNPIERLSVLRTRFFSEDGKSIMGGGTPLRLLNYGIKPYIENQFFDYRGITFALLHVPGSNNNFYDNLTPFSLCPATLNATDPNCTAQNAEYRARDTANVASLRYLFTVAKLNKSPAIVITIQSDWFFTDAAACNAANATVANLATKIPSGFVNFATALLTETANYTGKVLLVHGDSHFFRRCNPFRPLTNIEVLMVPGADRIGWVKANINPNSTDVFTSFQHFPQCTVAYSIYNAATDAFFGLLQPGATISNPPCSVNIRANVTCPDAVLPSVLMQLRSSNGNVVRTRTELLAPYYLFGDAGANVLDGFIAPGTYSIETTSAGVIFPKPASFTMGQCV